MLNAKGGVNGQTTIASELCRRLRDDIIRGVLAPGLKLRVEHICDRYKVGTSPAREALTRLSTEGLVEHRDQRGFFVARATLDDLRELVRTRCWLEERALRETIANRSVEWEDALVLSFHHLSRIPRWLPERLETDPEWEQRHRDFHGALIANCGSRPLLRYCAELSNQLERYRQLAAETMYPYRNEADEHKAIMESAIDGRADDAVNGLVAHYENTLRLIELGKAFPASANDG